MKNKRIEYSHREVKIYKDSHKPSLKLCCCLAQLRLRTIIKITHPWNGDAPAAKKLIPLPSGIFYYHPSKLLEKFSSRFIILNIRELETNDNNNRITTCSANFFKCPY